MNRAKVIVDAAYEGGYAIPAVCCYNLKAVVATIRAAEAKRSPALIQPFPWSIEYADGLLLHAAAEAADKASVPIGVHMDHAQDPEIIRRAADLGGFDGIMVDMSHYERDENMRLSKELVEYCNARGIITECEPGRINGTEDGIQDTEDLEEILTTPEQAEEFVALGIDWLAPAFGNVHGAYGPKGPQLDFPRLESMAKVNINGPVAAAYMEIGARLTGKEPLTTVMEEQTKAMQKVIEDHMDWLKSAGKV
ncbi:uncharacterized protein TRIVIDRAFT_59353 [Trichoderma virens Gv29-8]|uniref:Fructose-bisphosphate aldolase n=1 Tax=Hypocrea virens (strain Gv29-8 / FGSC 10586) TaxID=413071 RepID=G9N4U5_HYPVG|nr:uncharacterized protein TRIVIDRAFT_59353 [Trichoderma virens Gv29-8]EHK18619.1 hypothetical protein TRIVIDRAFT_59353 [Trichoderma virens Gv29-8]